MVECVLYVCCIEDNYELSLHLSRDENPAMAGDVLVRSIFHVPGRVLRGRRQRSPFGKLDEKVFEALSRLHHDANLFIRRRGHLRQGLQNPLGRVLIPERRQPHRHEPQRHLGPGLRRLSAQKGFERELLREELGPVGLSKAGLSGGGKIHDGVILRQSERRLRDG